MIYNRFYPKRPVKSFRDLEVYQKLLAISVMVSRKLMKVKDPPDKIKSIADKIMEYLLELPVLIAGAHSMRFGNQEEAINTLEKTMLYCNMAVVYLELYRDLGQEENETVEFYEEQIKSLLSTRMKILHLQMSWKKFMKQNGSH